MTYSQSYKPVMKTAVRPTKTPLKRISQGGAGFSSGNRISSTIKATVVAPRFTSKTSTTKYQLHDKRIQKSTLTVSMSTTINSSGSSDSSGETFSVRQQAHQFQPLCRQSLSSESDSGFSSSKSSDLQTHSSANDEVHGRQQPTQAKEGQRQQLLAPFSNKKRKNQSRLDDGGSKHDLKKKRSSAAQQQQIPKLRVPFVATSDTGGDEGGESSAAAFGSNNIIKGIAINNVPRFGRILLHRYPLATTLTHFASSKYFNAPPAKMLPKPPQHWLLGLAKAKAEECRGPIVPEFKGAQNSQSVTMSENSGPIAPEVKCIQNNQSVTNSESNLLNEIATYNLKVLLKLQT